MTRDEVCETLAVVALKWPHSRIGARDETIAGWLDELGPFDRASVEAAVRRLAGREHAPTAGVVAAECRRGMQGDAPSFDELQAFVARHSRLLPYESGDRVGQTAQAVAALEAAGAHEAVLRFVAGQGAYTVRFIPDGSWESLSEGRAADRRDAARHYRDVTVRGWHANPRAGLAVERACQRAGLDPVEVREVAATDRRRLVARGGQLALPVSAGGDEPTVDARALWEGLREQRRAAAAARAADRRAELAARQAAIAELTRQRRPPVADPHTESTDAAVSTLHSHDTRSREEKL